MLLVYTCVAVLGWLISAACGATEIDNRANLHHHRQQADTGFFRDERIPSLPLAVKSPYLSAWLPIGNDEPELAGRKVQFWNGHELEWTGLIRVDGVTYAFLGDAGALGVPAAKQVFSEFSATMTRFGFKIPRHVEFNVTFLTPVVPHDPRQQSLPFSFYELSVRTFGSARHDVRIYTDVGGNWLVNDYGSPVFWQTLLQDGMIIHSMESFAPQVFDEQDDRAMYGKIVLTTDATDKATSHATGHSDRLRDTFRQTGRLDGAQDSRFRRIGEDMPVLALSKTLRVSRDVSTALFAIGHVRDPLINHRPTVLDEAVGLKAVYADAGSSWADQLVTFFQDYEHHKRSAVDLDCKVVSDASQVSPEYAKICALSVRQAFASIELTRSREHGIQAWMKEISSDGNLNTVDVIYPAMPILLYLAPRYLGWLIEPILHYQSKGAEYESCAHDLGSHYPYATGPSDGSQSHMPVEESGNILILALAHAQATHDWRLVHKYYRLFERWTSFLLKKALIPERQLSTDDFMGPITNSSSLALKGGIGIRAMADLAEGTGRDGSKYRKASKRYIEAWKRLATSMPDETGKKHLLLEYHHQDTWVLAYNLFADRLFGYDLIPREVYEMQDARYSAERRQFGVPLDSRRTQTKTDWLIWAAAATHNDSTSSMLIQGVADYVAGGGSDAPFGDWYDTVDGTCPGFRARPVVGGHFALLALEKHAERRASTQPQLVVQSPHHD